MAGTTHVLTLMLLAVAAAEFSCLDFHEDSIACNPGSQQCARFSYLCDHYYYCDDYEDERDDLCAAWKNNDCENGETRCVGTRQGACIPIHLYCSPDSGCKGDLDPRICQMIQDGALMPLANVKLKEFAPDLKKSESLAEEFVLLMNQTIQHPRCPKMFTRVEDQCLSLFFVSNVSWSEARVLCQVLGGDLFTVRNISHYTTVVRHLKKAQLTVDFWVGGSMANKTEGWRWIDETPVEMGTPLWAIRHQEECLTRSVTFVPLNKTRNANDGACYHYLQAPEMPPRGHCLSLPYQDYYYMANEDCLQRKSPLCVLAMEK